MEFLTDLEALDNGLKKGLASGFLGMAVGCLRYYAGWADKVWLLDDGSLRYIDDFPRFQIHGNVMMDEPGFFNFTRHEP